MHGIGSKRKAIVTEFMRSDTLFLIVALADGIGMGVVYFGGLWLTIQILPVSKYPSLIMACSFFIRIAITLFGLYCIIYDGRWDSLLAFMSGFLLMRVILIRQLRKSSRRSLVRKK